MATAVRERVVAATPPSRKGQGINWWALAWIAPAVILLFIFFVYPGGLIQTIIWSFQNADSTAYVGLRNYVNVFTQPGLLEVLRNNLLWLVLGTLLTVGLGQVVAVLIDRVKIESIVKSALFVPMAISFVSAGVIWRLVYLYNPPDQPQSGLLNAILSLF